MKTEWREYDRPGLPDGEYDAEVEVETAQGRTSHVAILTYKDGRVVGYRNPWDSSGEIIGIRST
jgi:hypothetical protein